MLDLTEGVLQEFCERAQVRYYKPMKVELNLWHPDTEGRTCPKGIVCDDGVVYPSIRSAARSHGLSDTSVRRVLSGKRQHALGKVFRYA